MRRVAASLGLCTQLLIPNAFADHTITASTGVVAGSGQTMSAWGTAEAHDENDQFIGISGALALYEGGVGSYSTIDSVQFFEPEGTWFEGNLNTTGQPGLCYSSGLTVQTSQRSQTLYGENVCVPAPPVFDPPPVLIADTGEPNAAPNSPIVLNLANGSYRFVAPEEGAWFDLTADGTKERVSWPVDPQTTGLLFLDRNGNGVPDSGAELFGDRTPLMNGALAANGFQALAELDSNLDAMVTPGDVRWGDLRLWFDADRNGVAQAGELRTLDALRITSLSVAPVWSGRRDQYGNLLRWRATFTRMSEAGIQRSSYYDAYLMFTPSSS